MTHCAVGGGGAAHHRKERRRGRPALRGLDGRAGAGQRASVGFLRRLVPAPIAGLARRLWDAPGTESARTLLEALAKEARRDRITGLGAEVAFFVILSVFSALLVMALALGFLGSILGQAVAQQAQDRVIATLVLSVGTILTCAVMLATLVVGPLLGAGGSVAGAVGLGGVFATAWVWVRVPLLLVVLLLWAATVLHVAPDHATAWRTDAIGAALATAW